jgi:thiamine biosynthesis protein ThiC
MGFYTGRTGALFFNSSANPLAAEAVLKIRDWSLDTSLELLETTTIDTAVKAYTPGMVSSTGSATVMYYRSESGDVGVQFEQLLNKVMKTSATGVTTADRVVLTLRAGVNPGATSDIEDDIRFNAYITNASITVGTGELTSVAIQFTVDGPFLETVDS